MTGFGIRRGGTKKGPPLERHIGVQVDRCRRLRTFMAQPQSDHGNVDAAAEEVHGTGVAEDMR